MLGVQNFLRDTPCSLDLGLWISSLPLTFGKDNFLGILIFISTFALCSEMLLTF